MNDKSELKQFAKELYKIITDCEKETRNAAISSYTEFLSASYATYVDCAIKIKLLAKKYGVDVEKNQ